ncbi:MAG: class I SAM-dependent methyltransferase [Polyangiaceae bacterium]
MSLHPSDVLKSPPVYVAFQYLVGGSLMRDWGLDELAPRAGERILDIGCGPAYYVDRLGGVDYVGFDTDERYIESARKRFASNPRARFFCAHYDDVHARELAPFDGIMLMGLLHHLDDEYAEALLDLCGRSLAPGGRVVALDTVVFDGQSAMSRLLAKNDRGDHVRTSRGFTRLAERAFADVGGRVVGDTLRCPAASWLMTMRSPRTPEKGR